ncbi:MULTISPECIES: LuxR C-terminal-related transcriptional regulator [unclassified Serratia (in: enterobacteria)]|uniref:helix-turn-helix transcriptional regulator n=1 Tax=unclassified Serratia (in: enterobacteria) TaxID=2647522 RepID=UPI00050137D0|nr:MULTISPECIES: LuxR C-terminal-related transcriptional regulator [unclassified Serratia (in: enterobacteria)]KFK93160.1 hypothetical protein JV45_17020 [Serratia sp. Ag2]KFK99599.1 hypothetical protein IV04_05420 [Serratia sp. Ag1]
MKKNIIIKSPCNFITIGVQKILNDLVQEKKINSNIDIKVCENNRAFPSIISEDSFLIITLLRKNYTQDFILNLMENYASNVATGCKIVILSDFSCSDVLKNCIYNLCNSCIILDISMNLKELKDKVAHFLLSETLISDDDRKANRPTLSQREMSVLYLLLKGNNLQCIANHLGINYKTASHHKRVGLYKFGVRSLSSFMLPHNRINTLSR